jgi:hypothetical protein
MPKKVAHNCFQYSKLSHDEAQIKSCWDTDRCPNRRHYQRNKERISQQRRSLKTQAQLSDYTETSTTISSASSTTIAIDHPIGTAVSIIFYRERQDAPVHAIAAEIWQGNRKVLSVKPMHCLGLSPAQVVGMMADILKACSIALGASGAIELDVELGKFASKVELHRSLPPIKPCSAIYFKLFVWY